MLLADAMALQFSRPLFMIPLALVFLGELAGWRRTAITLVGFAGIALYARPFTAGFDPGAFVGAAGALFGALVVICIKRLSTTEPTRTIMFYYAISNAVFSLIPTIWFWVTPNWFELGDAGVRSAFLGISGQGLITHGWTLGDVTALVPLDYSRIVYSAVLGFLRVRRNAGAVELRRHGDHRREFALSRAHRTQTLRVIAQTPASARSVCRAANWRWTCTST